MGLDELNRLKDSLTGFHNRAALIEYLHNQIITSLAQQRVFSLLILDIDYFKFINDKYGHLAGDEALKFFTSVIKEALEGKHFAARFGGDEFIIVLNNGGQKEALEIAIKIKGLLNKRFFICKEKPLLLKSSMGIANFPFDANKVSDLIKKADDALYYSKKHGRNKIILASKLKSFYPKVKFIKWASKVVVATVVLFLFFKIWFINSINFQAFYSQAIVNTNYILHKVNYKYNYCSVELDNQSKYEGWIVRENKDKIYITSKHPFHTVKIIEIPKKRIRIYFKISK